MPGEQRLRMGLSPHAWQLVRDLRAQLFPSADELVLPAESDGAGLVWVQGAVLDELLCAARKAGAYTYPLECALQRSQLIGE